MFARQLRRLPRSGLSEPLLRVACRIFFHPDRQHAQDASIRAADFFRRDGVSARQKVLWLAGFAASQKISLARGFFSALINIPQKTNHVHGHQHLFTRYSWNRPKIAIRAAGLDFCFFSCHPTRRGTSPTP
jgi:hypothetical protein